MKMSVTMSCADCDIEDFVNMSNKNFIDLMDILDMPHEECGEFNQDQIHTMLMKLDNWYLMQNFIEPTIADGNVVYCGRNFEYVRDRIRDLKELFRQAIANNVNINYS
jgi:hypothetical protein